MRQMAGLSALLLVPALAAAQGAAPSPTPSPTPARPRLELSLDDAVKRALENNADIAVERLDPEASGQDVREAAGAYDPFLEARLSRGSRVSPATNAFAGGAKVDNDSLIYDFGVSKRFQTGGSLAVDFTNTRSDTNSVFSTFNPSYNSGFNLSLVQPLLRNLFNDPARRALRVARKNREISDAQFRQVVLNTTASVRQLYYDLLYAIDNLQAQRKSLDLARRQLSENEIKVRVGTLAPLDVVAAESEVATRDEGVIVAEALVLQAEDDLKRAIFPQSAPDTWALEIVPVDRPTAEPVTVNAEAAIARAMETRTDVQASRRVLEAAEINLQYGRNQTLPSADLVATYGTTGIGGTQLEREGLGGAIVATTPGGYSDAISQVFGRDFPTWTVGVNFSYPLGNRTASAQAARFRIARDQAGLSLRRLELQVAAEVRSAARAVETNYKRVESTRAARTLAERRLDAENKRFGAGMSTNFLVTQAQRDLALAEVAELRAVADYRKSLVAFERAQESGGGGVTIVTSTGR